MALSVQNQNFIAEIMQEAESLLSTKSSLERFIARWNLNDMFNTLSDADIAEVGAFSHLTKSEVSNCISAFEAILTALGDNVTGQSTNLVKMKG